MKDKPNYQEKKCDKCGHLFADFLHECPICLGIKFGEHKIAQQSNIMETTKCMKGKGI